MTILQQKIKFALGGCWIGILTPILCFCTMMTCSKVLAQRTVEIDGGLLVRSMDTVIQNNYFLVRGNDGTLRYTHTPSLKSLSPPQALPLSSLFVSDGEDPAEFYQYQSRIYLLGKITRASGSITVNDVIATLPPTSRPNKRHVLHAKHRGIIIRLNVEQNGEIRVIKTPSQPTDSLTLEGIDFFYSEKIEDIAGNKYQTIVIGSQEWFMSNLRTDRYRDGTPIPQITDQTAWNNATTGAWCWYNNSHTHEAPNGKLYNHEAAHSNKLCPVGWRVPSNADWTTLSNYLGGNAVAGGKLKETGYTHWSSTSAEVTNESGFTARGDGYRNNEGYLNLRVHGNWWSSSGTSNTHYYVSLISVHTIFSTVAGSNEPVEGYAVRCLKKLNEIY